MFWYYSAVVAGSKLFRIFMKGMLGLLLNGYFRIRSIQSPYLKTLRISIHLEFAYRTFPVDLSAKLLTDC